MFISLIVNSSKALSQNLRVNGLTFLSWRGLDFSLSPDNEPLGYPGNSVSTDGQPARM